ncbi:MAG: DUF1080 domain-containing protein [Pirellulales bacterium]
MLISHPILAALLVTIACQFSAAEPSTKSIQLFDGKTFTGWTAADGKAPPKNWTIEDGALVVSGTGGSLFTADEYDDFDLSFEWRITPHGNSGVKYRSNFYRLGVHGHPGWLGCEYQILDDSEYGNEPPNATNRSGVIYDLYPITTKPTLRPVGEFNDGRIVVKGPHIEHWINGTMVSSAEIGTDDWKHRVEQSKFGIVPHFMQHPKGRIELQDHNHKAAFRNIVLTPLDAAALH